MAYDILRFTLSKQTFRPNPTNDKAHYYSPRRRPTYGLTARHQRPFHSHKSV